MADNRFINRSYKPLINSLTIVQRAYHACLGNRLSKCNFEQVRTIFKG